MSKFSHCYSVKRCPKCSHDLTQENGVKIETYEEGEGNHYLLSRLDGTGIVLDVNCVIEEGLHSDTLCGKCDEPLNEYEEF